VKSKNESPLVSTTWWLLGLALAVCGSLASQSWQLLAGCAISLALAAVFGPVANKWQSIRLYLVLSGFILAVRVLFRVLFSGNGTYLYIGQAGDLILNLPTVTFTVLRQSVHLLGPVTAATLSTAINDGLRLCAIVLGVAMANIVANPRKLLRSTPSALYEVATAAAVAISLAPQLVASIDRVRKARELRGGTPKGLGGLGGVLIPVLEDTIQRSLDLAASMDSRGFGRQGRMPKSAVVTARISSVLAILVLGFATYLLLTSGSSLWFALVLFGLGIALLALTFRVASAFRVRSRLEIEKRTWLDFAVIAMSVGLVIWMAVWQVNL
jgi:energy-coupling factor transport system permease protein